MKKTKQKNTSAASETENEVGVSPALVQTQIKIVCARFSPPAQKKRPPPGSWRYYEQWLTGAIRNINHPFRQHIKKRVYNQASGQGQNDDIIMMFSIEMTGPIITPLLHGQCVCVHACVQAHAL